jgi:hypothetical protein
MICMQLPFSLLRYSYCLPASCSRSRRIWAGICAASCAGNLLAIPTSETALLDSIMSLRSRQVLQNARNQYLSTCEAAREPLLLDLRPLRIHGACTRHMAQGYNHLLVVVISARARSPCLRFRCPSCAWEARLIRERPCALSQ